MEVKFVSARHWEVSSSGCPVVEMHKLIHVGFLSHYNTDRPDFRPESQRHFEVEMLIPAMWNWICTPRQTCTLRSPSSDAKQPTEVWSRQKLSTILLRPTLLLKQSLPSVIRERTAEGTESIKNLVLWILVRAGGLLKALQSCSIYGRFLLGSTYTSWLNPEPRYNVHQAGTWEMSPEIQFVVLAARKHFRGRKSSSLQKLPHIKDRGKGFSSCSLQATNKPPEGWD